MIEESEKRGLEINREKSCY